MTTENQIAIAEACGEIICPRCGWQIDRDTCWCGDTFKNHSGEHNFVPMGCTCGFSDADQRKAPKAQRKDYNSLDSMQQAVLAQDFEFKMHFAFTLQSKCAKKNDGIYWVYLFHQLTITDWQESFMETLRQLGRI